MTLFNEAFKLLN